MKKLLASCLILMLVCALAAIAADTKTVTGWVVDDKCGVKSAHAGSEECAKKCLSAGAKMVVVTDSDKKMLYVSNPAVLQDMVGQHVTLQGKISGNNLQVVTAQSSQASAEERKAP